MDLLANIRYSARSFARSPGLLLALVFSIALGLGSNAVLYGFIRGLIDTTAATAGSVGVGPTQEDFGVTPEVTAALERVASLLRIAAAAVLMVACLNVTAFLLARAWARSRETSVRVALGASRARLCIQVLADAIVIAAAGGMAGLVLATWTSNILPALFFSADAEHIVYAPDIAAIVVSASIGVLITIACGLLPMAEMRDDRPATVLQRESAGPSTRMRRLRAGLVVVQMACCSALVVSAGLLLQSFRAAFDTPAGHRLSDAILATLHVRPDTNSRHEAEVLRLKYFREAETAAQSVAGVVSTAWVATIPGGAPTWQSLRIEPADAPTREVSMTVVALTPESLKLFSTPPVAGRLFGAQDTPETCRVAMVDQQFADAHFGGDAIGRSLEDPYGQRFEIVGAVTMQRSERTSMTGEATMFYYPQQQLDGVRNRQTIRVAAAPLTPVTLETNVVSRSFFEMMDSPAIAGSLFEENVAAGACGVGVVNHEAADRHFGGNALGASVIDAMGRRTQIIGVVQSPRLLALQRRVEPTVYFPMTQSSLPRMAMLIGTAQAGRETVVTVRRRLESVRGAFRPPAVVSLEDHLNRTALAPLRIATVLIGASAGMALVLGMLGLHGAMAEAARQQRREIALRIALGSQAWRVRRDVIADGARLAGGGIAIGLLGALAAERLLAQISPAPGTSTIWVWVAAPLAILASVMLAGVHPARRALVANPLAILRRD